MLRFNVSLTVYEWDEETGATVDFPYSDAERKALREVITTELHDMPIDILWNTEYPTGRVPHNREFVIGLTSIKDG